MKILRLKDAFKPVFKEAIENGLTVDIECQGINGLINVSIVDRVSQFDNAYEVASNTGVILPYEKGCIKKYGITNIEDGNGSQVNDIIMSMVYESTKAQCKYNNTSYTMSINEGKIYLVNDEHYLVYYGNN